MYKLLKQYFYDKISKSSREHTVYILPTLDGLKVVALNLTLLIIGLVYANNYVLLFNFILFCLFLSSMFYTHFNLSGIRLESIQLSPLYVKEDGILALNFSTTNAQGHYFIKPYFKSTLLKINHPKETFAIQKNGNTNAKISIKGIKRGKESIEALYIETLFPFNFFRCFTFFKINLETFIYPEKVNLSLHETVEYKENAKEDGDEFFLRDYQLNDSPKRVDWKKLAQTNRWYTRQFNSPLPNPIMLIMENPPVEDTLKSICFAVHTLHQQNIKYGIKLGKSVFISPENSPLHLNHCLKELASYEV